MGIISRVRRGLCQAKSKGIQVSVGTIHQSVAILFTRFISQYEMNTNVLLSFD